MLFRSNLQHAGDPVDAAPWGQQRVSTALPSLAGKPWVHKPVAEVALTFALGVRFWRSWAHGLRARRAGCNGDTPERFCERFCRRKRL